MRWKYVTYVSGMFANGLQAAFVAECAAEQGLFAPISDLLYERQADWKSLGDPSPVFNELAREVGVDVDELDTCIDEERPKARVRSGVVSGRNLGIRGTPGVPGQRGTRDGCSAAGLVGRVFQRHGDLDRGGGGRRRGGDFRTGASSMTTSKSSS